MGSNSSKNENIPIKRILTENNNCDTNIGEGNNDYYKSNIKIKNQNELLNSFITFAIIGRTPINNKFKNNELIKYLETFSFIGKKFTHISIFLGFKKEKNDYDGVCIEYGQYNENDKKYYHNEEFFVFKTGLKYTQMSLNEYILMIKYYNKNSSNDKCILTSCNINSEIRFDILLQQLMIGEKILNSKNFNEVIVKEKILEEIEKKYSIENYKNISNNCQDFASNLLKEIKAYIINPSTRKKIDFEKLNLYLPPLIVNTLKYNEEHYNVNYLSEIIDGNLSFFYNINKNIPLINNNL